MATCALVRVCRYMSLQRVREEVDMLRIQAQQVALDHHSEYPQQDEAPGKPFVYQTSIPAVLRHRIWNGNARHEHEERHD